MQNRKDRNQASFSENGRTSYNLVMLSGTVVSDIQYIECKSGDHVALFDLQFHSSKQPGTVPVAAFENVGVFCHENLKEGSTISIKVGNLTQYDGVLEIIANSIELFNSSGNLVNSVKKESRKGWADAATRDKASAPNLSAGESFDDLRDRLAKLEKLLSDAGKSHEK